MFSLISQYTFPDVDQIAFTQSVCLYIQLRCDRYDPIYHIALSHAILLQFLTYSFGDIWASTSITVYLNPFLRTDDITVVSHKCPVAPFTNMV